MYFNYDEDNEFFNDFCHRHNIESEGEYEELLESVPNSIAYKCFAALYGSDNPLEYWDSKGGYTLPYKELNRFLNWEDAKRDKLIKKMGGYDHYSNQMARDRKLGIVTLDAYLSRLYLEDN